MTLLRIDAAGPTELLSALGVVIAGDCGVITPGSR
jgi:hypothetical protein